MPRPSRYLKFTIFCGPPQGYYDKPDFLKHVWPFLLENSASIQSVYLFTNHYFGGRGYWQRTFGKQLNIMLDGIQIFDIGPITRLPPALLKDLRHRSFYGGQLNVLYRIVNKEVMARLCGLWPSPGTLTDNFKELGLKQEELDLLLTFLANNLDDCFFVAFGHDADPLNIFGSLTGLTQVQQAQDLKNNPNK